MHIHRAASTAVALVSVALAACGGGTAKNTPAQTAAESTAAAPAPAAPAPGATAGRPATGKVWEVKMYGDATGYRFDPKALTIRVGDAVRWVLVSGGPHDVTFWSDSIPAGAQAQLNANMPNTIAPLTAPMTMTAGETYTASFAGVPPGRYGYYCTPHLAMGMVASITVK